MTLHGLETLTSAKKRQFFSAANGFIVVGLMLIVFVLSGTGQNILSYAASSILFGNFHEVVPGKLYRSKSLTEEKLQETIRNYHILTVIDLRTEDMPPRQSHRLESTVVREAGAEYTHVRLESTRIPQKERLIELLDVFKRAKLPILIHCSQGVHRTGVAVILYLLEQEHSTFESARSQLSGPYGYFSLERKFISLRRHRKTLDNVLWKYEEETHLKIPFRQWIASYPDDKWQKFQTTY